MQTGSVITGMMAQMKETCAQNDSWELPPRMAHGEAQEKSDGKWQLVQAKSNERAG